MLSFSILITLSFQPKYLFLFFSPLSFGVDIVGLVEYSEVMLIVRIQIDLQVHVCAPFNHQQIGRLSADGGHSRNKHTGEAA